MNDFGLLKEISKDLHSRQPNRCHRPLSRHKAEKGIASKQKKKKKMAKTSRRRNRG